MDQKNLTAAFQDAPCAGRTCLQDRRVSGKQYGQPGAVGEAGLTADEASYETALLLARRLKSGDASRAIEAMRDDAADADAELAPQLKAVVATLDVLP